MPKIILIEEKFSHPGAPIPPYLVNQYYPVLASLVALAAPECVLEIGTRFGYSLAVMMGASRTIEHVISIDTSERDTAVYGGVLGAFKDTIYKFNALFDDGAYWPHVRTLNFIDADSQALRRIDLPFGVPAVDFAYIDGDHSAAGCIHDLDLVFPILNGFAATIVVDDAAGYLHEHVEQWAVRRGFHCSELIDDGVGGKLVLKRTAPTIGLE